ITADKYQLDRLLDNRLVLEGKKDSPTNELGELQARRDEMEAELSKEDVVSKTSGIMTHVVDGYEADVTPDKIEYYTPEAIDAWLDYTTEAPKNAYLKIINNDCWYYAFNLTVNQLDNLKIGNGAYIKTTSESTELIPVTVYDISDPSSDKRVTVTVQCARDVNSAFTNRKPEMIFVKKVYEGYKVPKTAVVVKNDVVGVYALMGGIVEFRPINIVYSSEDYIMISNVYDSEINQIHMYDDIILSTDGVKEGMLFT
ncbi:MAG: HlyD family efflux transporter periplasmic adaptor subunit, partial [Clostridia bacterium]|nr:HlyD family efflux transporter periplasmic adaptor subunit [Clostridia bacterium]